MFHLELSVFFPSIFSYISFFTVFYNRAYTETSVGNFVEQTIREQAVMKQLGQQLVLLYQPSVKCGLFRKVFHNSLLDTEVFRLPTLTPMSGCCYYSCLLRTALCQPGTFSLVQTCGQLAGSLRMCVHLGVCACML